MYLQNLEDFPPPPGVMGSLRAGFDVVSRHVSLILLPAALDVFLWLGPQLSISGLITPALTGMWDQARAYGTSTSNVQQLAEAQRGFFESVQHFNLLRLLGRLELFPVGVSSLLAQKIPVETPLGSQQVVEISSSPVFFGSTFLLVICGWVLGSLYFRWVSGIALHDGQPDMEISPMWAILQTLILSAIWMIGLVVIVIPILMVLYILTMISPVLVSGAIFVMALMSFWVVVPLFFTPHGIFVRRQNALYSILASLRMARFTLPTSGMFVLAALLLSTGLNILWNVPPDDSWMKLVGIGGHAFITTALLAASFVYYRDMNVWLQTVFERLQQKRRIPTHQV